MSNATADIVICGAGMAGVSAAYHLAHVVNPKNIYLIDERPPLSLTSDKSTECYRNFMPGPGDAMVSLMNHSIDLLEDFAEAIGDALNLNRRGYLFVTTVKDHIADLEAQAAESSELGAGPVRHHSGSEDDPTYCIGAMSEFRNQPTGVDLITDTNLINKHFPYLSEDVVAVLHARRCGWFSAQQLGKYMLEEAIKCGVKFINARVEAVTVHKDRIHAVMMGMGDGPTKITTGNFVIAAGPFAKQVAEMIDVELPVYNELHTKIYFKDHLGIIPREAPFLIFKDPQQLEWTTEERQLLAAEDDTNFLLEQFPQGAHCRPEGPQDSPSVLMLWTYHPGPTKLKYPIPADPYYPEITLRGLAKMIPGLKAYFGKAPKPVVDGGYYTKTQENRPLVGPLPVKGSWIIGAMCGFGIMASPACGSLLAAHISGGDLMHYAPWFMLQRYQDPQYKALLLEAWEDDGQL